MKLWERWGAPDVTLLAFVLADRLAIAIMEDKSSQYFNYYWVLKNMDNGKKVIKLDGFKDS